jgi:hypothetical protein
MHARRAGVEFPRIVPANAQRFQAKCVALGLETQRPLRERNGAHGWSSAHGREWRFRNAPVHAA